ncbi:MAG: hypothetical protein IJ662_08325 [Clostridia bacterium]|nr:hypothetical protein [Clostridia bacterium]
MELRFLGRGAAFFPSEGNTAAYIREGNRLLLLDCGETVFARLLNRGVLAGVREVYAAISHLHGDHCGSLGSLALYCFFQLGFPMTVIMPDGQDAYAADLGRLLTLFGVRDAYYRQIPAGEVKGFSAFTRFSYVPTVHDPAMTCFSFVFDTPRGGVFYSADTCRTDELAAFLSSHPQPEALYVEATDADYPGNIHLTLDRLAAAVPRAWMERTYVMHLNGPQCAQKAREMGFSIVPVDAK